MVLVETSRMLFLFYQAVRTSEFLIRNGGHLDIPCAADNAQPLFECSCPSFLLRRLVGSETASEAPSVLREDKVVKGPRSF